MPCPYLVTAIVIVFFVSSATLIASDVDAIGSSMQE
jgi:hypothetical protein